MSGLQPPPCGLTREELKEFKEHYLGADEKNNLVCKAPRRNNRDQPCGLFYNEHPTSQSIGAGEITFAYYTYYTAVNKIHNLLQ